MALLEFINENKDWQEQLQQPPYCIKIKQDGDYFLLKYDQFSSDFGNPLVCEARGCIIKQNAGEWQYVARPWEKFFNIDEPYAAEIDWNSVIIDEKIDGSLIKTFYDDDEWHISTNGTINAFQAVTSDGMHTYGELVLEALRPYFMDACSFFKQLDKTCTYMFELVSPYAQIVVPYDWTNLYFIGWRCTASGEEFDTHTSALYGKLPTPTRWQLHSLAETAQLVSSMGNLEGVVIRDKYFHRVKLKTEWWFKAHYLLNNNVVTMERLVDVILANEDEEFLAYCPAYRDVLETTRKKMQEIAERATELLATIIRKMPLERKEFALSIGEYGHYRDFMFKWYESGATWWEYTKNWTAAKWVKFIEEENK